MKSVILDDLLKDGFSKKYADFYLNILKVENEQKVYDKSFMQWAHSKGFSAKNAMMYGLNEDNYTKFLSDYDYYRIWPLNSWTRIWVNDKMTLKYMLANTELGDIMPKYYYYTSPNGLRALVDNPYREEFADADQFIKLLTEVKEFACKPCNGTASVGFFKMEYKNDRFYVDNEEISKQDISDFLDKHSNFVFTEFLKPAGILGKINPQIHTLRIVTINKYGYDPKIIGGYLRIPNNPSFSANYITLEENHEEYNIFTDFDFETGEFYNAKKIYIDKVIDIDEHPITKVSLNGKIENYSELREKVLRIANLFNNIEYMGFDIGVTETGFKFMEINTHPGIGYMQLFKPLFSSEMVKSYYTSKMDAISSMTDEQKKSRNSILR